MADLILSWQIGEVVVHKTPHIHNHAETATGQWGWCEKCQCMVTNKCDHRRKMCKHRAADVKEKGA